MWGAAHATSGPGPGGVFRAEAQAQGSRALTSPRALAPRWGTAALTPVFRGKQWVSGGFRCGHLRAAPAASRRPPGVENSVMMENRGPGVGGTQEAAGCGKPVRRGRQQSPAELSPCFTTPRKCPGARHGRSARCERDKHVTRTLWRRPSVPASPRRVLEPPSLTALCPHAFTEARLSGESSDSEAQSARTAARASPESHQHRPRCNHPAGCRFSVFHLSKR